MKSIRSTSLMACSFAAAVSLCAIPGTSQAAVTFTFLTGMSNFDGGEGGGLGEIGQSETLLDAVEGIDVTITTVDIIGLDGSLASTGTDNKTNITNNSLGINSADNGGYSTESQDFNPGEGWVFEFTGTVSLVEIDFASQGAGTQMTISSSAFPSFVLEDGQDGDIHDLGNTLVPAGTEITIQMTAATGTDTSVRISDFTVAAVPEPSGASLALLGAALLVLPRRRRGIAS